MCPICVYIIKKRKAAQSDGLQEKRGSFLWLTATVTVFQETVAASMWQQYQTLTSALSQQLCEQLRLILEPTQAAKLKSVKHTGNLDSLCCGETGPLLMWADAVCVYQLYLCVFICACPQGWLPNRKASEHEEGDPLYRQSVSQRQDLAKADEAQQERVPDLPGCGRLLQHGGQPL